MTAESVNTRTTNISFSFFTILGFLSFLISIVVLINTEKSFSNIYIIPLITSFMFFSSLLAGSKVDGDYINTLIYILYFIRNSFSVLLFNLSGHQTRYASIGSENNINTAVLMMCFETVLVFLYLNRQSYRYKNNFSNINVDTSKIFRVILYGMSLLCIVIYILIPEIRDLYVPIYGELVRSPSALSIPSSGISLFLYRLFNLLFPILQFLVPVQLIGHIRKNRGQKFSALIISFLLVLTPLFFISDVVAYSLIVFVTLFIILTQLYPKYRTVLILVLSLLLSGLLTYIMFTKVNVDHENNLVILSDAFQAYFPGLVNISASFKIPESLVTTEILQNELIRVIPLRQFIFLNADYSLRITNLFHGAIGNYYQIMPNISMAYTYIGWFAPFVSIIMISIAKKSYRTKSENLISYSSKLIVALYFSIGLVMYNIGIVLATFSDTLLWIIILASMSNVYVKKRAG